MKKSLVASLSLAIISTSLLAGVDQKACTNCHGANFEKSAIMKTASKDVSQMSHSDIATALKGYKAGTYGGKLKGLMKAQIDKYSDTELEAFAQTIGK